MRTSVIVDDKKYAVEIHWDMRDHMWYARAIGLPGCRTYDDTYPKAIYMIRDAIEEYMAAKESANGCS